MTKKVAWNKVITIFLAVSLVASITGCGKSMKSGTEKGIDENTYIYIPEYISLSSAENTYIGDVYGVDHKLYYSMNQYDEVKQESSEAIYCLDLNTSVEPKLYKNLTTNSSENGYTMKRIVSIDGGIISVDQKYPTMDDTSSEEAYMNAAQNASYYLKKTDKDDNEIFCTDITSYIKMDMESNYIQYAVESKNGYLYLSNGNSYIWIFDNLGNHVTDVKTNDQSQFSNYIITFGVMQDGRAAYIQNGNNGMSLHVYDESKKDFSETYGNLPSDCYNTGISPGINEGVLLWGQNSLYEYDPAKQEYSQITKWLDVNLNGDFIRSAFSLNDGNIAVYYNDWSTNENSVILLKKTLASEVKQKEVITLGCMSLSQNLQAAIVNFNKNNEQYKINIMNYTESLDWSKDTAMDDYNAAIKQFQNDIAAGNGPDLFVASDVDIDMLAVKGVIEDLNPYLDNSQVLKRSDLIEPVVEAFTTNGILCTIPSTFTVNTMTGRTSEVGEKSGWTLDDMISFANQYPDSDIFSYASNASVLRYSVMFDFDNYVNWETGECKFNTDEFKKVLEFAKQYPNEETLNYEISEPKALRTHLALLYITNLSGPQDWQLTQKMFDEPITAIGFPSKNSTGVMVSGNDGVCINASSKNKEVAWSFIESLFAGEDTENRFSWGFYTKKSLYDKVMKEAMIAQYERDFEGNILLDEEGNPVEISSSGYGWGDDINIDIYSVKQEEADAIWEIINQINGTMKYNTQLMNIIEEEAAPFLEGQKSVDEVVDIIQSRVQIYVNESR